MFSSRIHLVRSKWRGQFFQWSPEIGSRSILRKRNGEGSFIRSDCVRRKVFVVKAGKNFTWSIPHKLYPILMVNLLISHFSSFILTAYGFKCGGSGEYSNNCGMTVVYRLSRYLWQNNVNWCFSTMHIRTLIVLYQQYDPSNPWKIADISGLLKKIQAQFGTNTG